MPERKILCASFDRMVSDNRCITLKKAGYDVTATTNVQGGAGAAESLIAGHRFPAEEKYVLAAQTEEKSKARVLLVCRASANSRIPATSRVYALEDSAGLLSAVSALIPAEAGAGSQAAA